MSRPRRPTVAAALAVAAAVVLSGCGDPQPDTEAFWTDVSFYTDLGDEHEDATIDRGLAVCTSLAGARPSNEYGGDSLAAAWTSWVAQMGGPDADFFWETAVEHLCPDEADTFERLRERVPLGAATGS